MSYCPLCNSAAVFDRRRDGKLYSFGVSGMLRHSDMGMHDRQTESLWQQITGEAIVGTLTGKRLRLLSSPMVSFKTFRESFPQGKVLSRDTGHSRPYGETPYVGYESGRRQAAGRRSGLKPLDRLLVFSLDTETRAYPLFQLAKCGTAFERALRARPTSAASPRGETSARRPCFAPSLLSL